MWKFKAGKKCLLGFSTALPPGEAAFSAVGALQKLQHQLIDPPGGGNAQPLLDGVNIVELRAQGDGVQAG